MAEKGWMGTAWLQREIQSLERWRVLFLGIAQSRPSFHDSTSLLFHFLPDTHLNAVHAAVFATCWHKTRLFFQFVWRFENCIRPYTNSWKATLYLGTKLIWIDQKIKRKLFFEAYLSLNFKPHIRWGLLPFIHSYWPWWEQKHTYVLKKSFVFFLLLPSCKPKKLSYCHFTEKKNFLIMFGKASQTQDWLKSSIRGWFCSPSKCFVCWTALFFNFM